MQIRLRTLVCLFWALGPFITASAQDASGPFRNAPRELRELSTFRLGELVPDVALETVTGEKKQLSEALGENGLVIAFRSVTCPVSRRYGPTLARLEREYASRGFPFLFVNVSSQDSIASVREEIATFGFRGSYAFEPDGSPLATLLGVTTTTEVFLLDRARTLRYRGAIDDQYGIGYSKVKAKAHYLVEAMEALSGDGRIEVEGTTAPGCVVGSAIEADAAAVSGQTAVTYHNRVSRILQRNCQECHREGGAGPFPLETLDEARGFASMIAYVVDNNVMPPWFAHEATGRFANDRSLSKRDREALLQWIDEGAPEGDPKEAPLPRRYATGWRIGEPDAVFAIPEAFEVPPEGVVDYQYVYVETDFEEDRWISKMEVLPSAPQVTHHVLVFIEEPGRKSFYDETRKPDEPPAQGGLRGYFASTVPGQQPTIYPEGTAKLLPKGAWLKFQLHYTPNGTEATDRTAIGLVFAKAPPRYVVETSSAADTEFEIPPFAPNHAVTSTYTFQNDAVVTSFFPHMHLRARAFRYDLVFPDGREEALLDIPRYDFNWQLIYRLEEPRAVPKGTSIRATGWFDNSPGNPANPDPTAAVHFGEQTFEEMMIGYFDWYDPKGVASTEP